MPERFYIATSGPDDDAVRRATRWLIDTTRSHQSRAVVAIPLVSNVENLGRSMGDGVAATLRKHKRVELEGVVLELAIERHSGLARDAVTLAIWPTEQQLGKLEDAAPLALCVIPWMDRDVEAWLGAWGPTELDSGVAAVKAEVTNPVVAAALHSLTIRVNLSSGLGHPSDRAAAVGMFKRLHAAGETWEAGEVKAWALGHGWSSRGAGDLDDFATRIAAGRRVQQKYPDGWIHDIVDLWREQAREASS